ncbi:Uma2 family endonuclease [Vasconcelosia minhoensis]|nr:Uma2 family endonuclease [Romeria gracilis]
MAVTTRKFTFAEYLAYDDLKIAEYWIVDPLQQQVTVCQLLAGRYDDTVFSGTMRVCSQIFPALNLTADQVIAGKISP